MIIPELLSYMCELVVETNSCAPFRDAHQRRDTSQVQALKAELYQFKEAAMGMKALVA